mgnify:CR=1 FL=1|jgi:hypothetical protein
MGSSHVHLHSVLGQFGGTWWQFSLHHESVAWGEMLWHVVPGPGEGGVGDGGVGEGGVGDGGVGEGGVGDGGVGEGGVGAGAEPIAFANGHPAC